MVGPVGKACPVGLGAVGVEDLLDARDGFESRADLRSAPRADMIAEAGLTTVVHFGRRGLLQGPRDNTQVVEIPVLTVVGDHRLGEPGVENLQGLDEALPVLIGAQTDLDQLLRHAARAADLQPATRQVVEHADLLQDAPRLVERQHHAHGAEPQSRVERAMEAISRFGDGL